MSIIKERIKESIEVKQQLLENEEIIKKIAEMANIMNESLNNGGKILFCGNGGSASDAIHLTGEVVGKFQKERAGMAAIALNADVAAITAIANDYGYDRVFAREVEALMQEKDVLVGISTSGNSENVFQAIIKAKEVGGKSVALIGKDGGKIKDVAELSIIVPSQCTARIQEAHILIGHILCELLEEMQS